MARRSTSAVLLLILAAGCAAPSNFTGPAAGSGAIAREIDRQSKHPDRRAMSAGPPPGVPAELAAPLEGDARSRAERPLSSVLAGSLKEPDPPRIAAEPADDAERLEAMQLYVLGRSRRLDGDLENARDDLKRAARLAPGSAPIWRELGEAEAALGNRTGAASAFRRASELDPEDVRTLEMLSRGAVDRRDYAEALASLARLGTLKTEAYDPALPAILGARLGRTLLEEGYLLAGAEALRKALELPEQFGSTTNYGSELMLLYRQRGDLWRDLGDAAMRRGAADEARADYERAASLPSLNPGAITPRRVYALMKLGRSAEASWIVVEQARAARGRLDDRAQALVRHLAANSDSGPALSAALGELRSELSAEELVLAATSLARARACALEGDAALAVLRDHLRTWPADETVARDLFLRLPGGSPEAALSEAVRLIEAAPLHEARYSRVLLTGPIEPTRLLGAWTGLDPVLAGSDAGHVLHARLVAATGDLESAEGELAALSPGSPVIEAAAVARTEVLMRLGRPDDAQAVLGAIDENSSADARTAKALSLAQLGESAAALEMLTPLLHEESGPLSSQIDRLLLAARLSLAVDKPSDAELWLREVVLRDPTRDEGYAGLIAIYSRPGPQKNDARLIETVRALMSANPSSPTLRWLRAQEAVGRGQMDLAERDLLDLAEEYPDRDSVVRSLVQVWRSTRSLEKAEQWLRAQSLRRPWEADYDLELAGVLVDAKRVDEAVALLERRLARAPGDDDVSRRLESVLRNEAGQTQRADELTERRLARSPRSPDAMVELAELNLHQGDAAKAKSRVEALFAPPRPLSRETVDRLGQLTIEAARTVVNQKAPLPAPYLELVRFITMKRPDVPLQAHLACLQALARTASPLEAIIDSADRAAAQYPPMAAMVYASVYGELTGIGTGRQQGRPSPRPSDAERLLEHACTTLKPPPMQLMVEWLRRGLMEDDQGAPGLIRVLETARDTDTIDALITDGQLQQMFRALDPAFPASDVAHHFGIRAAAAGREDLALWLYRISLKHNPDHVMSNNNLGYSLLQRGEDLAEAEVLIERAYRGMLKNPQGDERSSITDSLGWARYKLGVIHDQADAQGGPAREGALTLLARATELGEQEFENQKKQAVGNRIPVDVVAIIADHYADALWQAGQRERAIEVWIDAAARAEATLVAFSTRGLDLGEATESELKQVVTNARLKAQAARDDRPPPVSPMSRPPNPAPAQEAPPANGMIQ